jgi:AcrR family transcriptional regulator
MAMAGQPAEIRQQIATAAIQMFRQYGYGKTTVGDIAKACSMSPANIYRFYPSKDAIIEAIARDYMAGKQELAQEISRRPTSASARLEAFALEILASTRNEFIEDARLYEIVLMCIEKHRPIVEAHLQHMREIVAHVVQDGRDRGEFHIDSVEDVAGAVFDSMCKFHHPQMVAQHQEFPLAQEAATLIRLLCRGLRSTEPMRAAS